MSCESSIRIDLIKLSLRISTLEILDEIEELDLVLDHYVISWGFKSAPATDEPRKKLDGWTLPLHPAPTYED